MSELNIPPSIEGLQYVRSVLNKQLMKERQRVLGLRLRIKNLVSENEILKLKLDSLQDGTIQP